MRKTFLRPQVSRRVGLRPRAAGLALLPALALGLSSCGPGADCLTSTGPVRTERRALPAGLKSVYAYDNVDLILVQDTAAGTPYAEVRAGQNLLGDLQTRVEGDQLKLSNTARCNWSRSYNSPREVTLHVPRLTDVFLYGAGNISTAGRFRQDTIFFHLTGAGNLNLDVEATYLWVDLFELGDVTVRGRTGRLQLIVGGNGRFFGQNLRVGQSYFATNRDSNGDVHLQATDLLTGRIRGNGTVYYSGNPATVSIELSGRGQARRVP